MTNDEGMTPEQAAHAAFEAQLRHTAELIKSALGPHRHFVDDCGDYLKAALKLSALLQEARMDGVEALIEEMKLLAEPAADVGTDDGMRELDASYASDGIAPELDDWVSAIRPSPWA
jgi:hypothetical protein